MKKRALLLSMSVLAMLYIPAGQAAEIDRLTVVKQYVDNVLNKASDTYHGDKPSPLLADGVDPEPGSKWSGYSLMAVVLCYPTSLHNKI